MYGLTLNGTEISTGVKDFIELSLVQAILLLILKMGKNFQEVEGQVSTVLSTELRMEGFREGDALKESNSTVQKVS